MKRLLPILAATAILAGCSPRANEAAPAEGMTIAPAAAAPAAVEPQSPHGAARGPEGVVTVSGQTLSTQSFAFDLPASWSREPPAQASVRWPACRRSAAVRRANPRSGSATRIDAGASCGEDMSMLFDTPGRPG